VHDAADSGRELPPGLRHRYERFFGVSLQAVRLFDNDAAAHAARTIQAVAFARGRNVFIDPTQVDTASADGQRVLAHELAHVVIHGGTDRLHRQTAATPARDDTAVRRYIDDALAANGYNVEQAFRDLQYQRNLRENCGNENLAAAEHYMFARHLVEDTWMPAAAVTALILGYSLSKLIGAAPSVGDCPTTPTSGFQVAWALNGVADGTYTYYTPRGPAS
jgi:hypothetical protein